jgi:CRP-like cAMP-binding protein
MSELMAWEDWVANACFVLLAASYLVTSMWWLRALAVVSLSCEIVYLYFAPSEPLWVGLGWDVVFVLINLLQLGVLARRTMHVRLSDEERLLRTGMFAGLDVSSLSRLLRAGSWRDLAEGTKLTREGDCVDCVYLLVRGAAKVEVSGRPVAVLQPGAFAGEMSFLSGERASATVTTIVPSRVFAVPQEELHRLMHRIPQMRTVLHEQLGRDLVAKLRRATLAA